MQIYKTKQFARFAKNQNINDNTLIEAINRAQKGNINTDLKGGIIIQRIHRKGQGKREGYRTVIIFKQNEKSFFVGAYERKNKNRLDKNEIKQYQKIAAVIQKWKETDIAKAIKDGRIIKVEQ